MLYYIPVLLVDVLLIPSCFCIQVDIAIPEVFVGGLLGSMLIYLFSAWACAAVGRTAQEVVSEVRRQFAERPGIMVSFHCLATAIYMYHEEQITNFHLVM